MNFMTGPGSAKNVKNGQKSRFWGVFEGVEKRPFLAIFGTFSKILIAVIWTKKWAKSRLKKRKGVRHPRKNGPKSGFLTIFDVNDVVTTF